MHNVNANGANIPALGFGTWDLRDSVATDMVSYALDIGYRHIDTAQMYGNEAEVGAAIAASPVARDDIFLTTKIWPDKFAKNDLLQAAEQSLAKLKVDHVDLLLLHWPNPSVPLQETIAALNEVKSKGQAKNIGISNFTVSLIDQAVALSDASFATNQVEYHPYLSQAKVMGKLRDNGIALTAYCPIARGQVFKDKTLQDIAAKYNKDPGQITLRWLVQQDDVIAIPRTSRKENAQSNLQIFDFELPAEDMAAITALARPDGRIVNVAGVAPDWDN